MGTLGPRFPGRHRRAPWRSGEVPRGSGTPGSSVRPAGTPGRLGADPPLPPGAGGGVRGSPGRRGRSLPLFPPPAPPARGPGARGPAVEREPRPELRVQEVPASGGSTASRRGDPGATVPPGGGAGVRGAGRGPEEGEGRGEGRGTALRPPRSPGAVGGGDRGGRRARGGLAGPGGAQGDFGPRHRGQRRPQPGQGSAQCPATPCPRPMDGHRPVARPLGWGQRQHKSRDRSPRRERVTEK